MDHITISCSLRDFLGRQSSQLQAQRPVSAFLRFGQTQNQDNYIWPNTAEFTEISLNPRERNSQTKEGMAEKGNPLVGKLSSKLPPELLSNVFQFLPLSDLKNALLVCRSVSLEGTVWG